MDGRLGVRLARHIKDRNEVRVENESEYEHNKRGCEKITRTNWKRTKRERKSEHQWAKRMKRNLSMVMRIKNLKWRMTDRIKRWQRSSIAFVYAGCAALERR